MTNDDYLRGWRDGYAVGRDDEAQDAPLRDGPDERQTRSPRDRQIRHPRRDR